MQTPQFASFTANEAIAAGSRVKLLSDLSIGLAGAADREIGVALLYGGKSTYAAGESVGVMLYWPSITCVAAGAFSAGATVQRMASGKVDDTGTGVDFGVAGEAAVADGDNVQVYLLGPSAFQAVVPANITTADASDLATAQALANANKATLNALLTALR